MKHLILDEKWEFRRGMMDSLSLLEDTPATIVNLPHDGMISTKVSPDAPAKYDSGYFTGDVSSYNKMVLIPMQWKDECVGLKFDGVMMHASIEINGCKINEHHYGYSPFYVDITDYVTFGKENRITINVNTGVQPSSRWYTGSGLFRGVELCHGERVHIKTDGIYLVTKEVADGFAFLEAQIDVENKTLKNRLIRVEVTLSPQKNDDLPKTSVKRVIQVNPGKTETAIIPMIVKDPVLWDDKNPNLYKVKAVALDLGTFHTHFVENDKVTSDEEETVFGIRTITVDAIRGLRINGKTVKLKGGCLHHDNGLLGAVSLYEAEVRKVKKLKEVGFNAIRTSHNPPSKELVKACDEVGMYLFDEQPPHTRDFSRELGGSSCNLLLHMV